MFLKGGKGRSGANADPFAKLTVSEATAGLLPGRPAELVKSSDGKSVLFKKLKLTDVGLERNSKLTFDDWREAGELFKLVEGSRNWWIGDWLNLCESSWGKTYDVAEQITGFAKDTLSNIASVCARVQLPLRNGNLSFDHHVVVAPLGPEKQRHWLAVAEQDELSARKLRIRIEEEKHKPAAASAGGVVVERSPLAHKANFTVFRRLWHGVELGDPAKVSREDIQHVREWLDNVEEALNDAVKEAKEQARS